MAWALACEACGFGRVKKGSREYDMVRREFNRVKRAAMTPGQLRWTLCCERVGCNFAAKRTVNYEAVMKLFQDLSVKFESP